MGHQPITIPARRTILRIGPLEIALPEIAINFLLFLFAYASLIGLGILCLAGLSYLIGVLL